ncbi:MAG: FixH family protein [Gammaproteobacteria bacterium]|nr:FixH family protein [Gammaproteobacteria bacterium]MDD9896934.1 FixH family protein [Gammaproteobacteria bacterium]MDD9959289.1 FixH family protein [Gammaproteobacteria bacterium]
MVSRLRKVLFLLMLVISPVAAAKDDPDLEMTTTDGYRLHVHSQMQPMGINQIHSWRLEISNTAGLVSGANISVEGGMPEHNHGLPTQPQVTEEIEPGVYLIEGIRFHMPGSWQMRFVIQFEGADTEAVLDFQL